MSFLSSMDISASGLTAQRLRMDVISQNIANIDTTRTPEGGPYRRQYVVMESRENETFSSILKETDERTNGFGVRVTMVGEDQSDFKIKYDPNHADADEDGYVLLPNVDLAQEMTDMISAYRSYEANVTAFNAYKDMAVKTLEIGRG